MIVVGCLFGVSTPPQQEGGRVRSEEKDATKTIVGSYLRESNAGDGNSGRFRSEQAPA